MVKITPNLKLPIYLALVLSTHSTTTQADSNRLSPNLFNKLKNTPTLDLANPRLESPHYKPLGLAIIRPSAEQKTAILNKSIQNLSIPANLLARCNFIGVNIELDDQLNTSEYLFTPDNSCLKLNSYQSKPFWILQHSANQAPKVVVADSAYQVRILKKAAGSAKRPIETILKGSAPSRYTQKPMEVRCHGLWNFTASGYTQSSDQSYIEVYRSTPSSSAKSWVIVEGQDPYVALDQHYRCPR
ncbi:MAG: hypothetical protein WAQ53_16600 [Thiofilum sp.]|uniref:hypothetical protein n=1 Tax=Thiofilum sp. TaxID=2212733 RepID=UPI0025DE921D|nr:hypothetical protein [Thiofilum sp.]MBK8452469.1 hypothetical protein [Thiofilum sp.]